MLKIKGKVDDEEYIVPFSKGILAKSLMVTDMGSGNAFKIAAEIEDSLKSQGIEIIELPNLVKSIIKHLEENYPIFADKYKKWRIIRKTKEPLIILIGGASGVGTSSMAFELASRLGLKNLISTDMIREVMRKIVSIELSPVIHESSFTAHESIRRHNIESDPIIEGYIDHVDVVNIGVEAIIERSLKEGISTIIEGVHIVPGFINRELIENNNIVMFILAIDNPEIHKGRFYSRCRQPWVKRSLKSYLDNFESIRKIQDFTVNQAKMYNAHIINNVDVVNTIDIMVDDIIERYGDVSVNK